MSRGVSEPEPRCPNSQAIALPLSVGRGQDASSATSLQAFSLQPQPGPWPGAFRLAMGWLGESRASVENASGFLNPLEIAVLESHLLWVLPPPKGYPSTTQTPGTGHPLSSVTCLGIVCFPKLLRVWKAGSPEWKIREHIFSPVHPMPNGVNSGSA